MRLDGTSVEARFIYNNHPYIRLRQDLADLCRQSITLYPAYICAYVGCVVILCSLIHFLACITANYAHIKKDRLLAPINGSGGGSLHGEAVATTKQKGGEVEVEDLDPIEQLRSDVMSVFRTDLSDSVPKADKDSVEIPL